MASKGTIAKEKLIEKIKSAVGADWIGDVDKKIYIWSEENGEKIQIAISLTCPKTPVEINSSIATVTDAKGNVGFDFEADPVATTTPQKAAEITDEERNNIATLLQKLGL